MKTNVLLSKKNVKQIQETFIQGKWKANSWHFYLKETENVNELYKSMTLLSKENETQIPDPLIWMK